MRTPHEPSLKESGFWSAVYIGFAVILMIAGMQQVIPNLLICVEIAASRRWDVRAKAVFDSNGRLQIWTPTEADEAALAQSWHNPQVA